MTLALLASIGTLLIVCSRNSVTLAKLAEAWSGVNKPLLSAVILGAAALDIFIGSDKLWRILRAMRAALTFPEVLRFRLGSGLPRVLFPLKSGEALNILFFHRHKRMPLGRASGAVFFDRGLNLVGATFWLLIGILIANDIVLHQQILLCLGFGAAYVVFFFLTPLHTVLIKIAGRIHVKLGRFAAGLLAPFKEFSPRKRLFFLSYGLLSRTRPLLVCYLLFTAFGIAPDPERFIAYTSIAIFAGHLPTTAGSGPREAAIVLLFAGTAPSNVLLSIGLLMTITVHVVPMMIGFPWIPWFLRRLVGREHDSRLQESQNHVGESSPNLPG